MAEQKNAKSSTVSAKSKEKECRLDEEIGKDFLSSWKTMSVTEDDAMDFSLDTIPKGKKKSFNFDKLDMDFNLDGDFDKLSSFKIDMPDLDFSSPPKTTAKAKEKSKEETTTGKKQEKKDRFTFSFNFNELENFDFETSITKGEKTYKESQNSEAVASECSENSKASHVFENDCIAEKLPVSNDVASSKDDASKVSSEAGDSNSKALPPQGLKLVNLLTPEGSDFSPDKILDIDVNPKSCPLANREASSEIDDRQTLSTLHLDSVNGDNSNQETVSNMLAEVCSRGTKTNTSVAAVENTNDKMPINEETVHENLHQKSSSPLSESERNDSKVAGKNIPEEKDDSLSEQGDIILKDISTASLPREVLENPASKKDNNNLTQEMGSKTDDRNLTQRTGSKKDNKNLTQETGSKKENKNLTPKLPLVSLDSEPIVSKTTAIKDNAVGAIRSNLFRSDKNKSQLHQPSPAENEVYSFSKKMNGEIHLCPTNGKSDGGEACATRIGSSRVIGKSSGQDKLALKGDAVHLSNEKNSSFQANLPTYAEKKTESGIQKSVNFSPQVPKVEAVQNSKILSAARKIAKGPALSSFMMTRNLVTNRDQLDTQRETNLLKRLEPNKDSPGRASKVLPDENAEKKTPKLLSLKRKTIEESKGESMTLKPLKKLLQSPSESRYETKELSERIINPEVQNLKNHMEISTEGIQSCHLTPSPGVPKKLYMVEEEIPLVLDNDGNLEKAEAYGKELEDICNMLKKKHEEAKEILARALVNNNNLLMLNHPIFQEKINMVQKFAELLISKEMQT